MSTSHSFYHNPQLLRSSHKFPAFNRVAKDPETRSAKTASSKYRSMSNKTRNDVQTIYNSTRYEDQSERDYDTYK